VSIGDKDVRLRGLRNAGDEDSCDESHVFYMNMHSIVRIAAQSKRGCSVLAASLCTRLEDIHMYIRQ
jgi:hypothetical protein